jgi:hypothetical protein
LLPNDRYELRFQNNRALELSASGGELDKHFKVIRCHAFVCCIFVMPNLLRLGWLNRAASSTMTHPCLVRWFLPPGVTALSPRCSEPPRLHRLYLTYRRIPESRISETPESQNPGIPNLGLMESWNPWIMDSRIPGIPESRKPAPFPLPANGPGRTPTGLEVVLNWPRQVNGRLTASQRQVNGKLKAG